MREAVGTYPMPLRATVSHPGPASGGLILGVSVFYLLRAFANGGSAMTGTEAISNGVSVFREPQARNARTTLVLMSAILGAMFLGVSGLAALTHAVPFITGTPTVVSEIGKLSTARALSGVPFYSLQVGHGADPDPGRQHEFHRVSVPGQLRRRGLLPPSHLTVRGHRLVYSNGILVLAVPSIGLLLATEAKVAA